MDQNDQNNQNNPIDNNNQNDHHNLIPQPVEENANHNQNADQQNEPNPTSFLQRITSKDILSISTDFVPSTIYIAFMINALVITDSFCDSGFPKILKALIIIYSAFVIKAIIQTLVIYYNTEDIEIGKTSLMTADLIINILYYLAILAGFFIYRGRPDECFKANTYATILIFTLVMIGIINISRHCLNFLMIIICFPIMVYYFLRNPQSFYTNFGIDPEIVRNLPTVKADAGQATSCAICTEDILEGNEILILRCPGKHYYHANCIKHWLIQKVNCPICRHESVL